MGTGEALPGPSLRRRSVPVDNRANLGKRHGSREGVGGGRSSDDRRDNTTRQERRAPASSVHHERWEEP